MRKLSRGVSFECLRNTPCSQFLYFSIVTDGWKVIRMKWDQAAHFSTGWVGYVVSDQHRLTSGVSTVFATRQSCHGRVFNRGNTCSNSGFKEKLRVSQSCPTLWLYRLEPARLLCSWDSPGNNTGVGCHSLLQGICWTPGQNPGLLHCK